MPLLDHLIELRKRLIYAIGGFLRVFFVTFYFAKPISAQATTTPPPAADHVRQDTAAKV